MRIREIKNGNRSCNCTKIRQQEAYINLISNQDQPLALKFGIAICSDYRAKTQNYKSVFSISNKYVFKFEDVVSCKAAEKECKETLPCGIVEKLLMEDGYTETTYLHYLDNIISIYKNHGGVEVGVSL
jgi:hypothetical protein